MFPSFTSLTGFGKQKKPADGAIAFPPAPSSPKALPSQGDERNFAGTDVERDAGAREQDGSQHAEFSPTLQDAVAAELSSNSNASGTGAIATGTSLLPSLHTTVGAGTSSESNANSRAEDVSARSTLDKARPTGWAASPSTTQAFTTSTISAASPPPLPAASEWKQLNGMLKTLPGLQPNQLRALVGLTATVISEVHTVAMHSWGRGFLRDLCCNKLSLGSEDLLALEPLIGPPPTFDVNGCRIDALTGQVILHPALRGDASAVVAAGDANEALRPFLDQLPLEPQSRFQLLKDLQLLYVVSAQYDARVRTILRSLSHCMGVRWSLMGRAEDEVVELLRAKAAAEAAAAADAEAAAGSGSGTASQPSSSSSTASSLTQKTAISEHAKRTRDSNVAVKAAKYTAAAVAGVGLMALTGGLAAPLLLGAITSVAGAIGLSAVSTGVAAVVTFLSTGAGSAMLLSAFGLAGGSLATYRMSRRVSGLDVFRFESLSHERLMGAEGRAVLNYARQKQLGGVSSTGDGRGGDAAGADANDAGKPKRQAAAAGGSGLHVTVVVSGLVTHQPQAISDEDDADNPGRNNSSADNPGRDNGSSDSTPSSDCFAASAAASGAAPSPSAPSAAPSSFSVFPKFFSGSGSSSSSGSKAAVPSNSVGASTSGDADSAAVDQASITNQTGAGDRPPPPSPSPSSVGASSQKSEQPLLKATPAPVKADTYEGRDFVVPWGGYENADARFQGLAFPFSPTASSAEKNEAAAAATVAVGASAAGTDAVTRASASSATASRPGKTAGTPASKPIKSWFNLSSSSAPKKVPASAPSTAGAAAGQRHDTEADVDDDDYEAIAAAQAAAQHTKQVSVSLQCATPDHAELLFGFEHLGSPGSQSMKQYFAHLPWLGDVDGDASSAGNHGLFPPRWLAASGADVATGSAAEPRVYLIRVHDADRHDDLPAPVGGAPASTAADDRDNSRDLIGWIAVGPAHSSSSAHGATAAHRRAAFLRDESDSGIGSNAAAEGREEGAGDNGHQLRAEVRLCIWHPENWGCGYGRAALWMLTRSLLHPRQAHSADVPSAAPRPAGVPDSPTLSTLIIRPHVTCAAAVGAADACGFEVSGMETVVVYSVAGGDASDGNAYGLDAAPSTEGRRRGSSAHGHCAGRSVNHGDCNDHHDDGGTASTDAIYSSFHNSNGSSASNGHNNNNSGPAHGNTASTRSTATEHRYIVMVCEHGSRGWSRAEEKMAASHSMAPALGAAGAAAVPASSCSAEPVDAANNDAATSSSSSPSSSSTASMSMSLSITTTATSTIAYTSRALQQLQSVGMLTNGQILSRRGWLRKKVPYGEQYALIFEPAILYSLSESITGFVRQYLSDKALSYALAHTFLSSLMLAWTLPSYALSMFDFIDSAWFLSIDRSGKAGRALAQVLLSGAHGRRPVTLVGWGMGARVIFKACVKIAAVANQQANNAWKRNGHGDSSSYSFLSTSGSHGNHADDAFGDADARPQAAGQSGSGKQSGSIFGSYSLLSGGSSSKKQAPLSSRQHTSSSHGASGAGAAGRPPRPATNGGKAPPESTQCPIDIDGNWMSVNSHDGSRREAYPWDFVPLQQQQQHHASSQSGATGGKHHNHHNSSGNNSKASSMGGWFILPSSSSASSPSSSATATGGPASVSGANDTPSSSTPASAVESQPPSPYGLIQDVILLGAPIRSDTGPWLSVRDIVAGRVVNGYCTRDFVLRVAYRLQQFQWNVAGLRPVGVPYDPLSDLATEVSAVPDPTHLVKAVLPREVHGAVPSLKVDLPLTSASTSAPAAGAGGGAGGTGTGVNTTAAAGGEQKTKSMAAAAAAVVAAMRFNTGSNSGSSAVSKPLGSVEPGAASATNPQAAEFNAAGEGTSEPASADRGSAPEACVTVPSVVDISNFDATVVDHHASLSSSSLSYSYSAAATQSSSLPSTAATASAATAMDSMPPLLPPLQRPAHSYQEDDDVTALHYATVGSSGSGGGAAPSAAGAQWSSSPSSSSTNGEAEGQNDGGASHAGVDDTVAGTDAASASSSVPCSAPGQWESSLPPCFPSTKWWRGIENVDITHIVQGHLEYRTRLEEVMSYLGLEQASG